MKKALGNAVLIVFLVVLYGYIWHLAFEAAAYEMLRASRLSPVVVEGK